MPAESFGTGRAVASALPFGPGDRVRVARVLRRRVPLEEPEIGTFIRMAWRAQVQLGRVSVWCDPSDLMLVESQRFGMPIPGHGDRLFLRGGQLVLMGDPATEDRVHLCHEQGCQDGLHVLAHGALSVEEQQSIRRFCEEWRDG